MVRVGLTAWHIDILASSIVPLTTTVVNLIRSRPQRRPMRTTAPLNLGLRVCLCAGWNLLSQDAMEVMECCEAHGIESHLAGIFGGT